MGGKRVVCLDAAVFPVYDFENGSSQKSQQEISNRSRNGWKDREIGGAGVFSIGDRGEELFPIPFLLICQTLPPSPGSCAMCAEILSGFFFLIWWK